MGWTPCMVRDESKPIGEQYSCPYENENSGSMCEWCEWQHNEKDTDHSYEE